MKYFHCELLECFKNRRLAFIRLPAFLLLLSALPCPAQGQESAMRSHAYVFAAPGFRTIEEAVTGMTHIGGGGTIFIHNGWAAEAEIGYLRPWHTTHEDLGLLSLNASYHRPKGNKLDRFVFAGFSWGLRDRTLRIHQGYSLENSAETLTLLNFGLGCTYWFTAHQGFRFEVRDHLYLAETDRQYLELRLAFTFR